MTKLIFDRLRGNVYEKFIEMVVSPLVALIKDQTVHFDPRSGTTTVGQ